MSNDPSRSSETRASLEPLLSVEELCDLLQVPRATIYQLTHRGRIPHFKIANRLRFQRAEILQWIEESRGRKRRQDRGV